MMRGQPFAVRLAVLLAGVVIVVLVAAGWVVNRAASRSLEETLGPRDEQRLELAVTVVEEALERGVGGRPLRFLLQRIAGESGGMVRVVDASGAVVAEAGRMPPQTAETERLTRDLSAPAGGGAFELVLPSGQGPFVRTFNAALLLTGIVTIGALLIAAVFVASRMTRPLREVTEAARRLGGGDLGARARGGSDAESAELAVAFNGMAGRLERSEELRRRAASDLAHDLATPATVLESQLQAMVDGVVPADAAQIERARAAAAGLSGVIAQLGELTQAEAAPMHRSSERVELAALAREIVGSLDGLLREHDVEATVVADDGEAHSSVDRGQVERAVRNLVTNAVQHSPPGGTIRLEVTGGASPQVRITDQGTGIAEEDLPYIFERFYRADRSRGRRPGSGIGLTVARELVAANGGAVVVESTGPGGTTFVITFPRAE